MSGERYQFRPDPEHGCCWEGIIIDTSLPHGKWCSAKGNRCGCQRILEIDQEQAIKVCAALNAWKEEK